MNLLNADFARADVSTSCSQIFHSRQREFAKITMLHPRCHCGENFKSGGLLTNYLFVLDDFSLYEVGGGGKEEQNPAKMGKDWIMAEQKMGNEQGMENGQAKG